MYVRACRTAACFSLLNFCASLLMYGNNSLEIPCLILSHLNMTLKNSLLGIQSPLLEHLLCR